MSSTITVIYGGLDLSQEGDLEKIFRLIEKIIKALGQSPSYQMRMQYEPEPDSFVLTLDESPIVLSPTQKETIMEYDVEILQECGANTNPLSSFDIIIYNP